MEREPNTTPFDETNPRATTDRTVAAFDGLMEALRAARNWSAAAPFVGDTVAMHRPAGRPTYTRDEWIEHNRAILQPEIDVSEDLVIDGELVASRMAAPLIATTTGPEQILTGIVVWRFVHGRLTESWTALRDPTYGQWSGPVRARARASIAGGTDGERGLRAGIAQYLQTLNGDEDPEALHDLFADPVVTHGPNAMIDEPLAMLVQRLREGAARRTTSFEDVLVAGDRAVLRWREVERPAAGPVAPFHVGLSIWSITSGRVDMRWQAALPVGRDW